MRPSYSRSAPVSRTEVEQCSETGPNLGIQAGTSQASGRRCRISTVTGRVRSILASKACADPLKHCRSISGADDVVEPRIRLRHKHAVSGRRDAVKRGRLFPSPHQPGGSSRRLRPGHWKRTRSHPASHGVAPRFRLPGQATFGPRVAVMHSGTAAMVLLPVRILEKDGGRERGPSVLEMKKKG